VAYYEAVKTMALKEAQYITDTEGNRLGVLVDLETYQRLRDAEEELSDIQAYDGARPKVMREIQSGQSVTLAQFLIKRTRKSK
jgi:hypothetical protein